MSTHIFKIEDEHGIFNPEDEDDLIHYGADECDGIGEYLGAWS